MPFSNLKRVPIGGGLSIISGTYTHTQGSAVETIGVDAGVILAFIVNPQVADGSVVDIQPSYRVSISGAINTITVQQNGAISAGTFLAIIDNG